MIWVCFASVLVRWLNMPRFSCNFTQILWCVIFLPLTLACSNTKFEHAFKFSIFVYLDIFVQACAECCA